MSNPVNPPPGIAPGPNTNKNAVLLVALYSGRFPLVGESQGICAISGYLKANFPGIRVDMMDLQISTLEDVLDFILRERPALLGISVKQQTFGRLLELYGQIENKVPPGNRPVCVIGNATPSLCAETILENYLPGVVVGVGEGEPVMADMYRFIQGELKLRDVRNAAFRHNGKTITSPKSWLSPRQMVLPDRRFSASFYNAGGEIYMESSRGCAYGKCAFCCCKHLLGSGEGRLCWRPRPVDLVMEDFKLLEGLGIKHVTLADEDFLGFPSGINERIRTFADAIINSGIKIQFRVNIRVNALLAICGPGAREKKSIDLIGLLKKAGLVKVFIGLESVVESQLKRYGKGFHIDQFRSVYQCFGEHQIQCELGLILFDPLLTFRELRESLTVLQDNGYTGMVSSVFKELRLQPGNPYLKGLKEAEESEGKKILGSFDIYRHRYEVLAYLDEDVDAIAGYMRRWIEPGYRLYYAMRIMTQYASREVEPVILSSKGRAMCFSAISRLKALEFELLSDMVTTVEKKGRKGVSEFEALLLHYEVLRRNIYGNLLSCLEGEPNGTAEEVIRQVSIYLAEIESQ